MVPTTIYFETDVTDLFGHRHEFSIPISLSSRDVRALLACHKKNQSRSTLEETATTSAMIMKKMIHQAQSTILATQPWVCCVCGQSNATRFMCVPGHVGTKVVGFAPLVSCSDPWCQESANRVLKRILYKVFQDLPDWTSFWNLLLGEQQEQA